MIKVAFDAYGTIFAVRSVALQADPFRRRRGDEVAAGTALRPSRHNQEHSGIRLTFMEHL